MEAADESEFVPVDANGRGFEQVIEHSTHRRNNVYLVNKDRLNTFNIILEGDTMTKIREESRQIYVVDNTPGIYFDLEKSQTFTNLCLNTEPIQLKSFLFPKGVLSLTEDFEYSLEEAIEKSILNFQKHATDLIGHSKFTNNSDRIHHHIVPNSASILLKLEDIVHVEEFLIQQNRDIYRELCHYACSKLPFDESAIVIKTRWNQDLNHSLYSEKYEKGSGIDCTMLGNLIEQFVQCIRSNYSVRSHREFKKGLRKYSREIVQNAKKTMKRKTEEEWKLHPGWWNELYVNARKISIEKIKQEFYDETNYSKMEKDYSKINSYSRDAVRAHKFISPDAEEVDRKIYNDMHQENELIQKNAPDIEDKAHFAVVNTMHHFNVYVQNKLDLYKLLDKSQEFYQAQIKCTSALIQLYKYTKDTKTKSDIINSVKKIISTLREDIVSKIKVDDYENIRQIIEIKIYDFMNKFKYSNNENKIHPSHVIIMLELRSIIEANMLISVNGSTLEEQKRVEEEKKIARELEKIMQDAEQWPVPGESSSEKQLSSRMHNPYII